MRFLRRSPLLYDAARAAKRALGVTTPVSRFLRRFSIAHDRGVNFVQVGASDGLRRDPIREFVVGHGWSGLLVEPLPGVFELLRRNYRRVPEGRLTFVNAAIVAGPGGPLTFWTVAPEALDRVDLETRLGYLRKSSLDREQVVRWVDGATITEDDVVGVTVPSLSFSRLMEEHWDGRELHLVVIDAEGYDLTVLQSIDFERHAPEALLYESKHLGNGEAVARELLEYHGYRVTRLGEDTAAVRGRSGA
ncbi:MAG: FkbM family methyltransferase [Gemmatimonadota bacterium]